MYTKQQLQAAIAQVPDEFSLVELEAILNQRTETASTVLPKRPDNLTPEQAAEWEYYTSPEALALYHRFPVSPELQALQGIIKLSAVDQQKSYAELREEALKEKYGI